MKPEAHTHLLDGIDGSNPLAFLAALGTLSTVSREDPEARMFWQRRDGAWRAVLVTDIATDQSALLVWVTERLAGVEIRSEFDLRSGEDNTTVAVETFRRFAIAALAEARPGERREVDFAAALGCDIPTDRSGSQIQDTALRTMSGSGNQHFLGVMRNVIAETTSDHIRRALFLRWDYEDSMQSRSLRWDPADDRRYAYRWTDPGSAKTRTRGSMLGANRLAIEALPLMPTAPTARGLATTGFRRQGRRVEWTWPIWSVPAGPDVVRTLLAMRDLQVDHPDPRRLRGRGVELAFRSERVSTGYYRNFTAARQV